MKQGTGSNVSSGQKREPIPHAVDPGGAAQLGVIVSENPDALYAGRGYKAPMNVSETNSNSGSQGKY